MRSDIDRPHRSFADQPPKLVLPKLSSGVVLGKRTRETRPKQPQPCKSRRRKCQKNCQCPMDQRERLHRPIDLRHFHFHCDPKPVFGHPTPSSDDIDAAVVAVAHDVFPLTPASQLVGENGQRARLRLGQRRTTRHLHDLVQNRGLRSARVLEFANRAFWFARRFVNRIR